MSDPNAQVRKRQYMLIGGAAAGILGLMGAGMFLFDSTPASYREKPKTVTITAPGSLEDRDAWRAQQAAREKSNETLISEVKNQLRQQDDLIKKQAKELEDLKSGKSRLPGAMDSARPATDGAVLQQPLPVQGAGQGGSGQRVLTPPTGPRPAGATATGAPLNAPLNQTIEPPKRQLEIIQFGTIGKGNNALNAGSPGGNTEVVGFPVDEKAKKYGTTQGTDSRRQIEFIPAGSFVRVAMLNGIDAPTGGQAQGNPLPVAFHVLDPANLPSKYKLDIKDCRVIGAAWGDLSSERSMIRLETLSCVLGNGETVEMAIKGQAIGEDGKAGLRGRLVTKQGQLLANALFAGALSGIGRAFQQSATTTNTSGLGTTQTIDPDKVGQAAIGGGVGQAGTMLAQYYLKAADKLYPVIETDGGRTIELLVTKGAVYTGKADVREDYRGLLKRTGSNSRRYEDD